VDLQNIFTQLLVLLGLEKDNMIKAIEKSPDGEIKIITHESEFILTDLKGGELTASEVKLLNLVEPNMLPVDYQPKIEQVDEPDPVTEEE
jgi:hypothetical protein